MTYPTTAECKAYAGVTGATEDTLIGQIRDGVVAQVERFTNRVFVAATFTRNYPDVSPTLTGRRRVLTFFEDLVSITSLTNGDGTVLTTADYDLWPDSGPPYAQVILRSVSANRFQVGSDGTRIVLVGKWGASLACPDDVFLAILELVHLSYGAQTDGSGVTISAHGGLIDKGQWPPRVIRSLKLRKR